MLPNFYSGRKVKYWFIIASWSVVLLVSLHLYTAGDLGSPFFNERLANLLVVQDTGTIDWQSAGFWTIPSGGAMLLVLGSMTGAPLLDVIYYPIVLLMATVSFTFLGRVLLPRRVPGTFVGVATSIYLFGSTAHFFEYGLGKSLYPLFVALIGLWWIRRDNRYLIAVPVFVVMKTLAPHAEVWALSFLASTWGAVTIGSYITDRSYSMTSHLFMFLLAGSGIFAIYNPKVYYQLLSLRADLLLEFSFGSVSREAFATSPISPPYYSLLNTIALSLAVTGATFAVIWLIVNILRPSTDIDLNTLFSKRDCLAIGFFAGLIPDTLVLAAVGRISLQLVTYGGVLICLYAITRAETVVPISRLKGHVDPGTIAVVVGVVLVVVATTGQAAYVAADGARPVGSDAANERAAEWTVTHFAPTQSPVLTDYHTSTLFKRILAAQQVGTRSPDQSRYNPQLNYTSYSGRTYQYLVSNESTPSTPFSYYLVNHQTGNLTVQKLDSWQHYDPPEQHMVKISRNRKLNSVYTSGAFSVYATNQSSHASKLDAD